MFCRWVMLAWLWGFQDKFSYLVLFSLHPSLFSEFRNKRNIKKFTQNPRSHVRSIDILNVPYSWSLLKPKLTCTFLNHPEQTPAHEMDLFLLWTPGKKTITLTLYSRFKLPWKNTTKERYMYNCFNPHTYATNLDN